MKTLCQSDKETDTLTFTEEFGKKRDRNMECGRCGYYKAHN